MVAVFHRQPHAVSVQPGGNRDKMPHFWNAREKYFISTSHKVMSSHLSRQDVLRPVPVAVILSNAIVGKATSLIGFEHFLVVRNPYHRLESFYKSKLLAAGDDIRATGTVQRCQRIVLRALGDNDCDFTTAESTLAGLSFAEFVDLLPHVYMQDGHLQPQSRKIYLAGMYRRWLKIESRRDLRFMTRELKIDTSYRTGNSAHVPGDRIIWDRRSRRTVESLYAADFASFEYPRGALPGG